MLASNIKRILKQQQKTLWRLNKMYTKSEHKTAKTTNTDRSRISPAFQVYHVKQVIVSGSLFGGHLHNRRRMAGGGRIGSGGDGGGGVRLLLHHETIAGAGDRSHADAATADANRGG